MFGDLLTYKSQHLGQGSMVVSVQQRNYVL